MADAETLSLAFMRAHPSEAARVLETVAPASAGLLLARAPARVAAPVVATMLPHAAARALSDLDDERALALLGALGRQSLVAILRHVTEPRRGQLIAGLPTAASFASQLLLGYAEDSVGAWTDPEVIALPGTTRASDALERVRQFEITVSWVFVTAEGGALEGGVPLPSLLRAPGEASLASIMHLPEALLVARSPLAAAEAHPGWERASLLPVVSGGRRLLGVLSHDGLKRALRRASARASDASAETLPGILARGYWSALSGSIEAMVTLLPSVRRLDWSADER